MLKQLSLMFSHAIFFLVLKITLEEDATRSHKCARQSYMPMAFINYPLIAAALFSVPERSAPRSDLCGGPGLPKMTSAGPGPAVLQVC